MKTCSSCKEVLSLDSFHNSKATKDGKSTRCKPCAIRIACEWSKAHPEEIRRRGRLYAAKRRSINVARTRQWRIDNKEHAQWQNRRHAHIRRARCHQAEGVPPTREEWNVLVEQFGSRCLACGATNIALTVDHVVPICQGGRLSLDNLQPLCKPCNDRKHTAVIDYREGSHA